MTEISMDFVEEIRKRLEDENSDGLREMVRIFAEVLMGGRTYPFVWLDAPVVKSRQGGRTINAVVVVATGASGEGIREVLGLDVFAGETEAAWLDFLRSLINRGLSGVQLVTSDAHPGLVSAIQTTLPGSSWQRCRTHFMTNLLAKVDKSARAFVATLVRTIFLQPDARSVWNRFWIVVEQLEPRFPEAAQLLENSAHELLAFASFPTDLWTKIWSNNPQERLNKEIRRRTDVVGIFPNRGAIIRLVGALLCEQTDEWAIGRRLRQLYGA